MRSDWYNVESKTKTKPSYRIKLRLKHRYCVRIRKLNPNGLPLLTEQIGVRIDNWNTFIDTVTKLKIE